MESTNKQQQVIANSRPDTLEWAHLNKTAHNYPNTKIPKKNPYVFNSRTNWYDRIRESISLSQSAPDPRFIGKANENALRDFAKSGNIGMSNYAFYSQVIPVKGNNKTFGEIILGGTPDEQLKILRQMMSAKPMSYNTPAELRMMTMLKDAVLKDVDINTLNDSKK